MKIFWFLIKMLMRGWSSMNNIKRRFNKMKLRVLILECKSYCACLSVITVNSFEIGDKRKDLNTKNNVMKNQDRYATT